MGLRITQDVFSRIVTMVEEYGKEPHKEVECKVDLTLDYYQFQRALNYVINTFKTRAVDEGTILDINSPNRIRTTIGNMRSIIEFCKSNVIPSSTSIAIMKKRDNKTVIDGYGFSVKSSTEKPVTVPTRADENSKMRLKRRVSVLTPCKRFRADFTVVREAGSSDVVSLIKNKTSVKYEIELELVQDRAEIHNGRDIARAMLEYMTQIMKVACDVEILMSAKEAEAVVKEYLSTVYTDVDTDKVDLGDVRQLKSHFAGPQPVTLERFHFRPDGAVSLLNPNAGGYSVTIKADGERHLLFVDGHGHAYILNNRLSVKNIGLKIPEFKSSLFDVELVTTKTNEHVILIFDTYLKDREKIYKNDLHDRLAVANAFQKAAKGKLEHYTIEVKVFVMADTINIFSATQKILGLREIVNYKTDGVIYTPIGLPVGGNNPGDYAGFPSSRTWRHVMKWKPAEDNTIDFLVRIRKDSTGRDIVHREEGGLGMYKTLDLYVGKNSTWVTPQEYYSKRPRIYGGYTEAKFGHTRMHVNEDGLMMLGGTEVLDESVVEMRYDLNQTVWIPLRVRLDKTEAYKKTHFIRGTANDYSVAESIWRTIVNPITERNISSEADKIVPTEHDMAQTYYDQDDEMDKKSALRAMRYFHNIFIKDKQLIGRFKGKATSLFDLACGRGGDLRKWIDAGIRTVVGIDLAQSNISKGAISRLMKLTHDRFRRPPFPLDRYVFLPLDASIPITQRTLQNLDDESLRDLTQVVWGFKTSSNDKLNKIAGIAAKKFDIVSCQFAIHYFFKDRTSLDGLIHNIDAHINDGGYFIGTCLDGMALDEMFNRENTNEINGKKDANIIWRLKKLYKGRFNGTDLGVKIGAQIESISGEMFEEYLVGFDQLTEELRKVGIVPPSTEDLHTLGLQSHTGLFKDLYTLDVERQLRMAAGGVMSEDEKKYSFMGRWFIFKKAGSQNSKTTRNRVRVIKDNKDA